MSLRDVSAEAIEAKLHELREIGDEYSRAHADAAHLDEYRKSKLAMLMKDAERDGAKTSAAQETIARAHPEYIQLLDNLKTATEIREKHRWRFKVAELSVGVWQTLQANQRQEQRAYGAR